VLASEACLPLTVQHSVLLVLPQEREVEFVLHRIVVAFVKVVVESPQQVLDLLGHFSVVVLVEHLVEAVVALADVVSLSYFSYDLIYEK
jgi:hypothetical protein